MSAASSLVFTILEMSEFDGRLCCDIEPFDKAAMSAGKLLHAARDWSTSISLFIRSLLL